MFSRRTLRVEVLEEFADAANRLPRKAPWQWLDYETYNSSTGLPPKAPLPIGDLDEEARRAKRDLARAKSAELPDRPRRRRGRPRVVPTVSQIQEALEQSKGNRLAAAALMKVSHTTFYRFIKLLPVPPERAARWKGGSKPKHGDGECRCGTCRIRHNRLSENARLRIARAIVRMFNGLSENAA